MTGRRQPSWRTAAGIVLILLTILIWVLLIAGFASAIGKWPILVQALFYLTMGIIWIIPLKPLIRWMETGSFKAPGRCD